MSMADWTPGPAVTGGAPAPPVASARALLRSTLPELYREHDFSTRFLQALEEVLDPVVAMLDSLAAYFDPALAPVDLIALMSTWVGADLPEDSPEWVRRVAVSLASELASRRGTLGGITLALRAAFPDLPIRVQDGGRTAHAERREDLPAPGAAHVTVHCEIPIAEDEAAEITRRVATLKPAHVGWRLAIAGREGSGEA